MKIPNEKEAVSFLNFLRSEADPTMDSRKERTPFSAVYAGIQNADDTVGWDASIASNPQHAEWCQLALDSIRSNCCYSEPEEICQWFTSRGLTY
jgi:hypothetical protein